MNRSVLNALFFISSVIIPAQATGPQVLRILVSNSVGASLAPALLDTWLSQKGYGIHPFD